MPREKQYATDAERQAAYRERKRQELEAEGLPVRDVDEDPVVTIEEDGQTALVEGLGPGFPTLDEYVLRARVEAAAYADAIGEDDKPHKITDELSIDNRRKDRIRRAENYARWRYAGVLVGEVSTL